MSHVTFDTAKRLEAAGFPQPERRKNEFWYNPDGFGTMLSVGLPDGVYPRYLAYFGPTATDILKELGSDYNISFMSESWYCENSNGNISIFSSGQNAWSHENPAECAAMAWLQIHEKK